MASNSNVSRARRDRDALQPTSSRQRNQISHYPTNPSSDPAGTGRLPRPSPGLQRPSSIGIRRLPSSSSIPQLNVAANEANDVDGGTGFNGRRRSTSAPQRPASGLSTGTSEAFPPMETIEESSKPEPPPKDSPQQGLPRRSGSLGSGRLRSASEAAKRGLGSLKKNVTTPAPPTTPHDLRRIEYEREIVDMLDVVDPEVSTLNSLTNVQNSLFIPNLGRLLNRHPTYTLSRRPPDIAEESADESELKTLSLVSTRARTRQDQERRPIGTDQANDSLRVSSRVERRASITSHLSDTDDQERFAVLPHGISLAGWSEEDKAELNDHVRHMLHSRRSKFARTMKAFGKYIRKPLGFFVTLYAVLITLFGLGWVLFLIGWISVGQRQPYIENVIDNVLVALFAVVGDGLIPWRIVDTYHMSFIAHYHHLTWRLRRERNLPKLQNHNDLPEKRPTETPGPANNFTDPESNQDDRDDQYEFSMLSPAQQKKLVHHQNKFSNSHSFYKPHETATHHAFPLRLLVAIVVLLDCHSCFQVALGACTWAISYHVRPQALTATILCCSITVNITAGVLISIGDRKTRKKEVVKQMLRQALTEEALRKMEKERQKQTQRAVAHASGEAVPNQAYLLSHEDSRERDEHGRVVEIPGQGHALSRRA